MSNSTWYDPCHPDADWSGFIKPRESRKHPTGEAAAMKLNLMTNLDSGYVPNSDANVEEWNRPGRRILSKSNYSSDSLIGGPISNSSKSCSPDCWESETQAACRREKTSIDQLTTTGRSMHIRSRKVAKPAFEQSRGYDPTAAAKMREENPYKLHETSVKQNGSDLNLSSTRNDGTDVDNLVGYRSHRGGIVRGFLSNLSSEIAEKIYQPNTFVSAAPFANDGDLPTDPYLDSNGNRRKDLLLENFSNVTPGYTGKREFL